jgi:hypothetical protein
MFYLTKIYLFLLFEQHLFYAALTSVHVLLAPVTTLAHGVEKGLPVAVVMSNPVTFTTASPIP